MDYFHYLYNMISILIPTYNYCCTDLVRALQCQCASLGAACDGFAYEILLADDASPDGALRAANAVVSEWEGCRYLQVEKNLGRARIRNFLADEARYPYLLFIDSDAQVASDDFVLTYWNTVRMQHADVVCGGVANVSSLPDVSCSLRYRYERHADSMRPASVRMKYPCARFTTFNFLIRRTLFQQVRFSESCIEYGYEDVLFGMHLERRGIRLLHIDNALVHAGLEQNAVFLSKTEVALRTLHHMDAGFQEFVAVSRCARRLEHWHMSGIFLFFYRIFRKAIRRNLLGHTPSVLLFSLYKLGYYISLKQTESHAGSA